MKNINTNKAPSALGPYSQAIIANNLLFVSGQMPLKPKTMELAGSDIATQTKQTLENLKAIVEKAGVSLDQTVRVGIFLKNMNDFDEMNKVYETYFRNHKPARACVEVARLAQDVLVEIEAIVAL